MSESSAYTAFEKHLRSELSPHVTAGARYRAALYGCKDFNVMESVLRQAFLAGVKAGSSSSGTGAKP